MDAKTILVGAGTAYVAPVGTVMPAVNLATPAAPWVAIGETQGGLKAKYDQKIEEITSDQRTGPVKAVRTEESLAIETECLEYTLEKLAYTLGNTVTDTAEGVGTIGTRSIGMSRGATVDEYAFLFRGSSPYMDSANAQYEVPRGYFAGAHEVSADKKGNKTIKIEFHALEDLDAVSADERFGKLICQDAAALP